MNEEPLLQVHGVKKRFGGVYAVDGLDLNVRRGEIVSVIGPNGAGKTTAFNLVTGLIEPDAGDIVFDGHHVVGSKPNHITKLGIARTFQTVHLFPNMTVLENAMVGQHCRTRAGVVGAILKPFIPAIAKEEERIRENGKEALAFFGSRLGGFRHDMPAASLSYANRRRLEIARALATEPKLLLLDEPTAGMNPRETEELTHQIAQLRDQKDLTIVVIEHDMRVVKGVSDRVVALDYGQKIAEGTYEEVAHNEQVIEAYLGRKEAEPA